MAKVDGTDTPSFYMNPSVYSAVKEESKKTRGRGVRRSGQTGFSRIFDDLRARTAEQLGPVYDLPVSEETVNVLMDEVRSTGDTLRDRPFPDEILRYKQAVRNFMHYVVTNSYSLEHEAGIKKHQIDGFTGQRSSPDAQMQKSYTKIQVIDKKLEDMAAMLLSGQLPQLKLAARLEEINGLLVDLLQ